MRDKNSPPDQSRQAEMIGLFCVGLLLLGLAWFGDPIGSDPDSGLIELSRTQAKWLLGVFGGVFIAGGVKSRRSR
jgi:hypothetical protein